MTDPWIDRLSEYLDEDLSPRDRAACDVHLRTCTECAGALEELRGVLVQARSIPNRAPAEDLWPGIAARLDTPAVAFPSERARGGFGRRFAFTLPQLAAAGFVLALMSAGGMWLAMNRTPPVGPSTPATTPAPLAQRSAPETTGGATPARRETPETRETATATTATLAGFDEERYADAVAELERVLHDHRAELDTSTVRILEQNLAIIDRATEQARRALLADPANPYLNNHLAEQMKKKIQLLQIATDFVAVHHS